MKAALFLAAAAAATLAPAPAGAQADQADQADQGGIHRLAVYGHDPCPRAANGDDIVVCARRPETERYRIPKELRDQVAEDDPESTSWAARAEDLEYVGRSGTQSCSTVGSGGVSGCWNELVRTWRRDRR